MVFRKMLFTGAATTIAATTLISVPATSQAATTYKACANKKTGQMRLLAKGKKCKKGEKKLTWNTTGPQGAAGPQGTQGPQGAQGVPGLIGLPGAYDAFDQTTKKIGPLIGFFAGQFPMIRMEGGAILVWDNVPTNPNALTLTGPALFYREAGCAGDAYGIHSPGLAFDVGILMGSPAAPGSPVFHLKPGTPQAFTSVSVRTPAGCAASASAVSNAYVAVQEGVVPAVAQPMYFKPAS